MFPKKGQNMTFKVNFSMSRLKIHWNVSELMVDGLVKIPSCVPIKILGAENARIIYLTFSIGYRAWCKRAILRAIQTSGLRIG
jgi:hypothetical protein